MFCLSKKKVNIAITGLLFFCCCCFYYCPQISSNPVLIHHHLGATKSAAADCWCSWVPSPCSFLCSQNISHDVVYLCRSSRAQEDLFFGVILLSLLMLMLLLLLLLWMFPVLHPLLSFGYPPFDPVQVAVEYRNSVSQFGFRLTHKQRFRSKRRRRIQGKVVEVILLFY